MKAQSGYLLIRQSHTASIKSTMILGSFFKVLVNGLRKILKLIFFLGVWEEFNLPVDF